MKKYNSFFTRHFSTDFMYHLHITKHFFMLHMAMLGPAVHRQPGFRRGTRRAKQRREEQLRWLAGWLAGWLANWLAAGSG